MTLSKILVFTPVDEKGELTCYNDCAAIFLKEDTLINVCGGYTFYFVKYFDFKGGGSITKELSFPESVSAIVINYDFYKEPDELIVSDQNGKVLYRTGMKVTNKTEEEKINLNKVTKVIFKIDSQKTASRWAFSVRVE